MKVVSIPLDKIEQNENSRVVYKQTDLAELMSSMKREGLLQPIGVRLLPSGNYDAVFGNRRIVAAKKLDWLDIPAHVLELPTEMDRDIVGLVENFKRQNTTLAEDGRMFRILKDRGLSNHEIAARLEISVLRVDAALEVLEVIPEDFHRKIIYTAPGGKKRVKDHIPASTAIAILNARKQFGLNRQQTRAVLNYAADNKPSVEQIGKIGPLIKSGVSIQEAIERVADLERVALALYIPSAVVARLEHKYDTTINQVIYRYIAENKELKASVPASNGVTFKLRKFSEDARETGTAADRVKAGA